MIFTDAAIPWILLQSIPRAGLYYSTSESNDDWWTDDGKLQLAGLPEFWFEFCRIPNLAQNCPVEHRRLF